MPGTYSIAGKLLVSQENLSSVKLVTIQPSERALSLVAFIS
jgi:hypothetical protein